MGKKQSERAEFAGGRVEALDAPAVVDARSSYPGGGDDAHGLEVPELGVVRLGRECEHGVRSYAYLDLDGEERRGYAQRRYPGESSVPAGDYEVAYREEPGCFGVLRPVRFRGPSRAVSPRYRRGRDEMFGRHQGKSS